MIDRFQHACAASRRPRAAAPARPARRPRRFAAAWFIAAALAAPPTPLPGAELAELERAAFDAAVDNVADGVVQIRTIGGLEQLDRQLLATGPTTGLILTADGYIASSAFNFAQQPASILVRLPNGEQRPAQIVGRDANRMLVLLKVEPPAPLPVPPAAPLDEVHVGDWAIALGRTFQADRVDRSVGVVSALGRMLGRVVQTDASASPANYGGPLVDIRGRVIGVLVPMAPESGGAGEASALAGVEFYDSGIGFAVPLAHILATLPRWIEAKDLHRGLLGVGFVQGSAYATAPEIAAVWPQSPAAKAGWRKGDVVTAVNGQPVDTQMQLRLAVVPHYAGDSLRLAIRRGAGDDAERLETEVTLTDKLAAFRHAFLGVLPARPRDQDQPESAGAETKETAGKPADDGGLPIRGVWPGGPAERAGLQIGDRLVAFDEQPIAGLAAALAELNAKNPGEKLAVTVMRGGRDDAQRLELAVDLAPLPESIPPLADSPDSPALRDAAAESPKLQTWRLPEFSQRTRYVEPVGPVADGPPAALVIWLGEGDKKSCQALAAAWEVAARGDRTALVMPAPGDKAGWSGDDMEYLVRILRLAGPRFGADPRRTILVGQGKTGQLAYALALGARRAASGVAVIDAPLPRTLEVPQNSPTERLAVLSIETQGAPLSPLIRQDAAKLRDAGFPVSQILRSDDGADSTAVDAETAATIARWLDGLDRL